MNHRYSAPAALALSALIGSAAFAQTPAPGVYTDAQAQAGRAIYAQSCSGCHQPGLNGYNEALPLKGTAFLSNWRDRPIGALYNFTTKTMPVGSAGSLSPDAYAAVIAYILQANGAKPGAEPLAADARDADRRGCRRQPGAGLPDRLGGAGACGGGPNHPARPASGGAGGPGRPQGPGCQGDRAQLPAGDRRHAARPLAGRLADVPPHL